MSDNNKVYADGLSAKIQQAPFGEVMRLSIKSEDFIKCLISNTQENGWVTIDVMKKQNAEEGKNTHYGVFNTWKPNSNGVNGSESVSSKSSNKEDDDLPF